MLPKRLFWTAYLAYHLRGQARYPFKPLAAIRRDQARRVRSIVAYAYRHVPYYRETLDRLGLVPSDFRTAADLAKLPVLEREQVQRDPDYFFSSSQRRSRCLRLHSGGSTGAPIAVYHDTAAAFQVAALGQRFRSIVAAWVGRRTGFRQSVIVSPTGAVNDLWRFWQTHSLLCDGLPSRKQRLAVLDPLEQTIARLNDFKPDVLGTYGSYLNLLIPRLCARGQPCHLPKAIVYGADALSDSVRRLITEELRIPLLSLYQAIEAMRIAFECERHRGMHVNIDVHPVRIVDAEGRTLPPGEPGEVVVSNLLSRATVLLNYRLHDLAALLPDPCPCGRSLPLISFPLGRLEDFIVLPSGETVMPNVVGSLVRREEEIWQYQIVQETPTRFRMLLVVAETCDRRQLAERIRAKCPAALGQDAHLDVVFVDTIERTAAGKHRRVISLVQPSRAARPQEARGPDPDGA